MVTLRFSGTALYHRKAGPIRSVHPWHLMGLEGFQREMGVVLNGLQHPLILAVTWNKRQGFGPDHDYTTSPGSWILSLSKIQGTTKGDEMG